ncbi:MULTISPECIES: KUP/HAK/KT family potassium transporter [unclassified Mucilaginibacter]|uniref:KUP/HAK/KT family potassium transporter n=1 Tax=unclassified Mucilaginibacter TaxID=2617802 RepID=UPI002AC93287|nr:MULTISPECIES: KUP/HAK/KT family potassium transporter [unclassified Mucilaginibacter]MEB0260501.1 KUP/HAK/KT family potassium transporter [Mucilaginibacter sp. 10I4]MEB0280083.1 KUP/HAK/KT family potassium transporter [Mucilaginibacter sp. 10B2]MEB0303016.1 KUP/HAK/KT family potassium transporter [Mucilaginibacter sp. 5C4]WPX23576.1 KUP/HAK/KT family potassium transporter [Mucilaginibacter sp. 5C4]
MNSHLKKLSAAGVLITLGIIFGDIGTSPLYVFQTLLIEGGKVNADLVLGSISCIFWTLTLQTTFKYIIITLQADNRGEGGIFSLYALVRRYGKWLAIPAIIGAGTLLADGIITPPISVTSAIEGLNLVPAFAKEIVPGNNLVLIIVISIMIVLFFFQQFGTKIIGSSFGPVMLIWFSMLSILGIMQLMHYPQIFKALNPYYGARLLIYHPNGFWLLGAVFLCTTGAEALYSDLGHCGRKNIQVTWIFVKTALMLNYLGQGAWVLMQPVTKNFNGVNPFFEIVPHFFLIPSIAIATLATIIASQALISGSFTLISEAISMNFWPRITVKYPSNIRGQIYIPSINWILCFGCIAVSLYFRTSANMTNAYGFSITIAMLMTTILMYYFMRYVKHWPVWLVTIILCVFLTVEFSFFVTNAVKLLKRLFFLVFEFGLIFTMYIWFRARKINNRFLHFIDLKEQIPFLKALSADQGVSKYATHLIYLTKANNSKQIEQKIMYSILSRKPKRADVYWFIHIERTDEPYTMEYTVDEMENDKVIRVEFRLGFRIQPRINLLFRKVVEDMVARKELDITSKYASLSHFNLAADFQFVIMEKFLSYNNEFSVREGFILTSYFAIKKLAQSEAKAFGLDTSETRIEKIPLIVKPISNILLKRVEST